MSQRVKLWLEEKIAEKEVLEEKKLEEGYD